VTEEHLCPAAHQRLSRFQVLRSCRLPPPAGVYPRAALYAPDFAGA
jgi:hypothetical protein